MDPTTTDAADTATAPSSPASTTSDKPTATYTKEDLTRIVQREVGKVAAEYAPLKERLAALEQEKQAAEEAKLSQSERLQRELARKEEALGAKIAEASAAAKAEREKRYTLQRQHTAGTIVTQYAAKLLNPGLAPHVERLVMDRIVIEAGDDGTERLAIQMGDKGDTEPLTPDSVARFAGAFLTPFLHVQGGSGARFSGSGTRQQVEIRDPNARIAAGLSLRK